MLSYWTTPLVQAGNFRRNNKVLCSGKVTFDSSRKTKRAVESSAFFLLPYCCYLMISSSSNKQIPSPPA